MKNRIAFLHYLYREANLDEITKAKMLKSALDAHIIGETATNRKMTLEHFYNIYANKFPKEINSIKKKPSFSFSTV